MRVGVPRVLAQRVWCAGQPLGYIPHAQTPVQWTLQDTGVRAHALAASPSHVLAACASHVQATGQNEQHALGTPLPSTRAHRIPHAARCVAAGNHFSWIGTPDGVYACGTYERGQLGEPRTSSELACIRGAPNPTALAAGLDHVVVLAEDQVWTTGCTSYANQCIQMDSLAATRPASPLV